MRADQLIEHAMDLLHFLRSTGHADANLEHRRNVGRFNEKAAYQATLPTGAGVYMFEFDDGDVFYIGKTEAERDDFARVWRHLGTTAQTLEHGQRGFPKARFLSHFKPGSPEFEAIRSGHFGIGYLIIEPAKLASLFEVYLQTICALSKDGLPACNSQIG